MPGHSEHLVDNLSLKTKMMTPAQFQFLNIVPRLNETLSHLSSVKLGPNDLDTSDVKTD